jgi:transposase
METIIDRGAGLDVHKETVTACVRCLEEGDRVRQEVKTFGTMTGELLGLADWLKSWGVTHVAMESTGVYWKPIFNLLEGEFEILLVNARHVKHVPGRKTDVKDCEWLAQLLQCGLLRASFVPERPQRELRDLTRQRRQLVADQSRVANRIQKVLEDANIKLGSVASDVLGVSGRAMLAALIDGQTDAAALAKLARGRLREKEAPLRAALAGRLTEHHRFLLRQLLEHWTYLGDQIRQFSQRIEVLTIPFAAMMERLDEVPGLNRRTVETVLAEVGTDITRFPSAEHLSSWAGMCPGNNESAGKRKSGRTPPGNRWLRGALTEAAWGTTRCRKSYLAAQYHRIARRAGKKRALIAVAHSLLVIIYYLMKDGRPYVDLGPDHFDRLERTRLTNSLVRRLQALGHKVIIEPAA